MIRKVGEADDQIDTGGDHQVHFADVVGGARHRVTDRTQVVEGHAFAEQADVQLFAGVAFGALAEGGRRKSFGRIAAQRAAVASPQLPSAATAMPRKSRPVAAYRMPRRLVAGSTPPAPRCQTRRTASSQTAADDGANGNRPSVLARIGRFRCGVRPKFCFT